MNGPERHRLLLQGLLGDSHVEAFVTDPNFHQSIELLTQMLPAMVDGLALATAQQASQRAEALDRLRRGLDIPEDIWEQLTPTARSAFDQAREADERLGAHLEAIAAGRLCSCPDPERAVDPRCPIHGHSPEARDDD